MAFVKYAKFEGAQVLDLKGSDQRVANASLQKLADFEEYRTEDGYLYARIRAISSRVNKNHDGWPSVELAGGQEAFERFARESSTGFTAVANKDAEFGYSTFLGKPIFVDHHNSDPERARGVIVDSKLHVDDHKTASELDPYYASAPDEHCPPTWVELLLEVDAKSFPKLAKAIIQGSKDPNKGIDGFSMGCDVERSVCSICKNSATTPDEFCKHVKLKGHDFKDSHGKTSKSYEDCYGIKFFEISAVFDPADETALLREVRSSVHKEADDEWMYRNPWGAQGPQNNRYEPNPDQPGTETYPDEWNHPDEPGTEYPPQFPSGADQEQAIQEAMTEAQQQVNEGHHPSAASEILRQTLAERQIAPDVADQVAQEWLQKTNDYMDTSQSDLTVPQGNPDEWYLSSLRHIARKYSLGPQYTDRAQAESELKQLKALYANPRSSEQKAELGNGINHLQKLLGITESTHIGQAPLPQADHTTAPEEIDTLRKEKICDICGSSMDSETCDVCGNTEEPEGFDNPDLSKAKDSELKQGEDPSVEEQAVPDVEPSNPATLAHVTSEMDWSVDINTRTAGRINPVERPILPAGPATSEPDETVLEDPSTAVTSSVRTAKDFIAAAGATNRRTMNHSADAASGAPAVAKPDVNVDATGVGGVADASNEQASNADAQIDVTGVGGTGVEGVSADSTKTLPEADPKGDAAGFDPKTNIEKIPTKTFDDGSSAVERQADPVSNDAFPSSGGVTSGWQVEGYDDGPYPVNDGLGGGNAVQGVQPVAEQFGERVDVLDHTTSPSNNSGPTKTWSGTDGNGVTKQVDGVTPESLEGEDIVNIKGSSHIFSAFKLADLEIELGLLDATKKYDRAAELEAASPAQVQSSLAYAVGLKTAGLSKTAKQTKRLPVLGRNASVSEPTTPEDPTLGDSALFGR